jgi:hypothetical protein
VPNWPISVGSALPATAAVAAGLASGFATAGFAGAFGAVVCACAGIAAPHTNTLAAKAVSIRRTDMKSRSPIIVTGRWPGIFAHTVDG